jgi:hypothetical protein
VSAMYRAFWFSTDAGCYWSVLNDEGYEVVDVADRFLQYVRFGRGAGRVHDAEIRRGDRLSCGETYRGTGGNDELRLRLAWMCSNAAVKGATSSSGNGSKNSFFTSIA